jgi:RimJ/RimL family protein N-acetyltransferase
MLKIRPLQHADRHPVLQLGVGEEQRQYVGTTQELLSNPPPDWHLHVIEADEQIIGVFNIDHGYSQHMAFADANDAGLRSFLIDQRLQGRGYGRQTVQLLPSYLQQHYPSMACIWLTVNCRNTSAHQCYLKGGFMDSGELYHGGQAGPQHIMRLSLI